MAAMPSSGDITPPESRPEENKRVPAGEKRRKATAGLSSCLSKVKNMELQL